MQGNDLQDVRELQKLMHSPTENKRKIEDFWDRMEKAEAGLDEPVRVINLGGGRVMLHPDDNPAMNGKPR